MTDEESTKYLSFDAEQKSKSGAKKLLEATILSYDSTKPMHAYAVEELDTRKFVGFCGLNPHDIENVEIMYAVMPDQRKKGYATEVAATLARYALNEFKFKRVLAPISPKNVHSRRVAERVGFKDRGLIQHKDFSEKVHDYVLENP